MNERMETAFKAWVEAHDFWKSDESDWRDKWELLASEVPGMGPSEVAEFLDGIIGLAKAEYGE